MPSTIQTSAPFSPGRLIVFVVIACTIAYLFGVSSATPEPPKPTYPTVCTTTHYQAVTTGASR